MVMTYLYVEKPPTLKKQPFIQHTHAGSTFAIIAYFFPVMGQVNGNDIFICYKNIDLKEIIIHTPLTRMVILVTVQIAG